MEKQCVSLSVRPCRALMDEQMSVLLVEKTPPGAKVTLHSVHFSERGHKWEAYGHYVSDDNGTVNVLVDPSLGGTYFGVEPMGLFWSLRSENNRPWVKLDVQTPLVVSISVYLGHQTEGFKEEEKMGCVLLERWFMLPGVKRVPITDHDLTATLFLPPGPGPFPGVLDLWGGGRSLLEHRAALLASKGFAAMAINFNTPEITLRTGEMVDNNYFETAYEVLKQHPNVMGSRIAMLGLCTGAALTLNMAVYSEVMKLSCAVCMSGTHRKRGDGTLKGLKDFYDESRPKRGCNEKNQDIYRYLELPIPSDPALKVDVGRLQCPLLVIAGEDDQCTPAYEAALDMKQMMEKEGNSHLLTVLSYPNTGHLIEPPYTPHDRASSFIPFTLKKTRELLWGGEPAAHCLAQEDAWRKTIIFLKKNLCSVY